MLYLVSQTLTIAAGAATLWTLYASIAPQWRRILSALHGHGVLPPPAWSVPAEPRRLRRVALVRQGRPVSSRWVA